MYSKYRYSLSADVGGCLPDFYELQRRKDHGKHCVLPWLYESKVSHDPIPARIWWRAGSWNDFALWLCQLRSHCVRSRRPEQCRTIRFPDQLLPRWCEWRVHHHFLPTRCLRQLPRCPFRYMEFLKLLFRLYVLFA